MLPSALMDVNLSALILDDSFIMSWPRSSVLSAVAELDVPSIEPRTPWERSMLI